MPKKAGRDKDKAHLAQLEAFKELNKKYREKAAAAMKYAEESPWPELSVLGEDVYAPD